MSMSSGPDAGAHRVSVIVPAHNEEAMIGRLLASLADGAPADQLDIVVVCNGCSDRTAEIARSFGPIVRVLEVAEASKRKAQLLGDKAALGYPRAYIDADVIISHEGVALLAAALSRTAILATAPARRLDLTGASCVVRRYYSVWQRLPQVREGLFGRGVVVVSAEAGPRIPTSADLLSDDLAMSEAFAPYERCVVQEAVVSITLPRTTRDLLRRRIRIATGTDQLDGLGMRSRRVITSPATLRSMLADEPILALDVGVFLGVTALAKLGARRRRKSGDLLTWDRDESSRTRPHQVS